MSITSRTSVAKHKQRKASTGKNSKHVDFDENMPILLRKRQKYNNTAASRARENASNKPNQFPKTSDKNLYKLQFDQSINMQDIWVDSKTLDYMNKYGDNIFVSSNFMQVEDKPQAESQPKPQATRTQP